MQVERVRIRIRRERLSSVVNLPYRGGQRRETGIIRRRSIVLEMILLSYGAQGMLGFPL